MGQKNKLAKWADNLTFGNIYQPKTVEVLNTNYPLKGKWNAEVFKNNYPIVLELGCGKGEYSVGLAKHFPNKNFIGLDIKGNRIWKGAKEAFEKNMNNVIFIRTRIDFITSLFNKNEVDEIWITFPDPQPKDRLARKRLTSPLFIERYKQILKPNGIIHLKTDHEGFFRYTLEEIEAHNYRLLEHTFNLYREKIADLDEKTRDILSIKTFYENLFSQKGHNIHYLKFQVTK
ncbi:MAG: tRNA (guanosine(46)-N7)-methyltransferase TrmB [Flavobacteriales bacterium]|jgi:tRNA (guanine-N7-)-methyltransferase|nr:tRNA (guanosine(46)-N7)-methyltransferase TrmB [Flavobacteriales bacterium]MBQ20283.1 tRNA (guanosine(46)-N7)-methyltransferase TrmB [Flavobacteriales bacterium]|tara:strand:+ start:210048 stop:210740 length:693 start_codon:yes stop_codon:yes gene_type:complete